MEKAMQVIKNICNKLLEVYAKIKVYALNIVYSHDNVEYIITGSYNNYEGYKFPIISHIHDRKLYIRAMDWIHGDNLDLRDGLGYDTVVIQSADNVFKISNSCIDGVPIFCCYTRLRIFLTELNSVIFHTDGMNVIGFMVPQTVNCKLTNVKYKRSTDEAISVDSNIIHTIHRYGSRQSPVAHFMSGNNLMIVTGCFMGTISKFSHAVLYSIKNEQHECKMRMDYLDLCMALMAAYHQYLPSESQAEFDKNCEDAWQAIDAYAKENSITLEYPDDEMQQVYDFNAVM